MTPYLRISLCLVVFCVIWPVLAEQRWTVTSLATPGSIDEANWQLFLQRVRREAPEVELRALIYGEGGTEESYLSRLRRGRVNVSTASFAASTSIVPEVAVLSLPYLFESTDQLDFVIDEYLHDFYSELFEQKGLALLRWLDVGWVSVYGNEPAYLPAMVENMRLRSPASPAAQLFLRSAGADVIVLPFAEVLTALQTGLIDGGVTSGLMYAALLSDHAHYLTLTRHSYEVGFLLANAKWLERLPEEYRTLVTESFPQHPKSA